MAFSDFLSPVLSPLLYGVGPFWTVVIVSLFVSLMTTFVYKYATDQTKLRKLKADLKRHQKKATALQKEDPKKALALQKEMMQMNGQYMKMSFRSTLYTFLPVILFFGWLSAFLSFAPLAPDTPFDVTITTVEGTTGTISLTLPEGFSANTNLTQEISNNQVSWRLSAKSMGSYDLTVVHDSSSEEFIFPVEITTTQKALAPSIPFNGLAIAKADIAYEKLAIFDGIFFFQDIPWVGSWGWLGAYILFSLIFSTSLRKFMKLA